jgi:hypothetical protein
MTLVSLVPEQPEPLAEWLEPSLQDTAGPPDRSTSCCASFRRCCTRLLTPLILSYTS